MAHRDSSFRAGYAAPGLAGTGAFPADALIEELLRRGLDVRVEITGRSMRPLLRGGEIATVAPADPESLARGELILRQGEAGRLLLHRLVRVEGSGAGRRWWTQGDALMACDEPCAATQILGRVVSLEGLRLPLAPAALRTDAIGWRLASRGLAAVAHGCRLARRVAARLRAAKRSPGTPAAGIRP